jgi:hypothetical protein
MVNGRGGSHLRDVENDVVAGDAGQQCFTHGRFDGRQSVVEHRCQHPYEPPVGIVTGAELAAQPCQRRSRAIALTAFPDACSRRILNTVFNTSIPISPPDTSPSEPPRPPG